VAWYLIEFTGNFWIAFGRRPTFRRLWLHPSWKKVYFRSIEDKPITTIICTFGDHARHSTIGVDDLRRVSRRHCCSHSLPFSALSIAISSDARRRRIISSCYGRPFVLLEKKPIRLWMRAVVQDREMVLARIPVNKVYIGPLLRISLSCFSGVLAAPIVSVDFMMGREVSSWPLSL